MCRLFALSGGPRRVSAEFWLLRAPDSLASQSHADPDGTGLGTFDERGEPIVQKAPVAAFADAEFFREARTLRSRTFLAHLRFASAGAVSLANTHPFEQDRRLFAHNGVLAGLDALDAELGDDRTLVRGETDSERLFALITRETRRRDGDLQAGLAAALSWVAANLPLYALNMILTTDSELHALRYPANHDLYVLERPAGGHDGDGALRYRSSLGVRVRSDDAARYPVVVLASEPLDADPGWRLLASGELLRVDEDLRVTSAVVLPGPPAHPLTLEQVDAAPVAPPRPQPD